MMIDWAPFAVRRDGPADKHGYNAPEPAQKDGLVCHSMTGSLEASLARLDGPDRASWTFSNPKAGPLLQHYPVGFHSWASGSVTANVRFTSCEHEGGPDGNFSEPLTPSQVDNLVQLVIWLRDGFGWLLVRRPVDDQDSGAQLYEHRECIRFGSLPTACPSGRIPWDVVLEKLGGDMTPEQLQQLNEATAAIKYLETIVVELKSRLDAIGKAAGG